MVPILDGILEYVAHACRKIGLLGEKIQFVTALDLIKCLNQIKKHIFLPSKNACTYCCLEF